MHAALFTVLTDCTLFLAAVIAGIAWCLAGFPTFTVTFRR